MGFRCGLSRSNDSRKNKNTVWIHPKKLFWTTAMYSNNRVNKYRGVKYKKTQAFLVAEG